jgi:uncharacterized protein
MPTRAACAAWIAATIANAACVTAYAASPSFDCTKVSTPDERVICKDPRLAELDRLTSIAFVRASQKYNEEAQKVAVEAIALRRACGSNPLCILDQQVKTIGFYSDLESTIPVPPWVGAYRYGIFRARNGSSATGLPKRVGQCTITRIKTISTRFGGELKRPDATSESSGSTVSYANLAHQVSYDYVEKLADSRIGDSVLLCLASVPAHCPPGDNRGRFYSATNLRTKGSWILPDAQHTCGGA